MAMDEPDSLGNHHYHSIGPPTDEFRRNDDSCCSHGGALDSGHLNPSPGHLPRKRERSPDDCPDVGNSGKRFLGDVPTLVDEKDGDCPHLFATNRKFSTRDGLASWAKDVGKRSNQLSIVNHLQQLSDIQRGGMVCIKSEKSDVHRKKDVKVEHSVGTGKCQCVFGLEGDDEEDGGCKLNGICSKHNHELSTGKLRVIDKNERFSLQHLVKLIVECNYKTWNRTDPVTGTVNDILFGDQRSLALLQARPYVLAIYCTCNRNKRPFLEVVGFTSSYKSFSVVFAFLSLDAVENYVWALQNIRGLFEMNNLPLVVVTQKDLTLIDAVETVFPEARHLLLRQDIYKDVEEKCSKVANNKRTVVEFMKGWKCVVEATDEVRYGAELSFLELDFDHLPDVMSYVKETWLIPYKEKIVSAWADRNTHFGMHVVNVVVSVHSRLKSCLGSSATSFEAIWMQLRSIVELQLGEIERKLEASQTTVPFSVASSELYIHLKDHV